MKRRIFNAFTIASFLILSACSGNDDSGSTEQPIDNVERYSISLINNNYDISHLFFIINDDYDNPINTCYSFTVSLGDVVKVCGETNIISNDVFVTVVLSKNSENIKSVNLIRSNSYINHQLNINGLCDNPNANMVMGDARLWKDGLNAVSFIVE